MAFDQRRVPEIITPQMLMKPVTEIGSIKIYLFIGRLSIGFVMNFMIASYLGSAHLCYTIKTATI
jgi:hypothetical protein